MTPRDDLAALIQRVEAAEGPSRELDAEIIAALVGGEAYVSPFNGKWCVGVGKTLKGAPREWEPRTSALIKLRRLWIDDMGPTASLDAAASLVPSGWAHGYCCRPWLDPHFATASVWAQHQAATLYSADAATPALALCAAALRARQAMEARDE
jgi:hypothetical protein